MTDTLPSERAALARADFISQTTAVEQARAVAEVQAAIVVAQQNPRVEAEALRQMHEACNQTGLAERAFYSYPRAGKTVSGASIHLARELARCWGNVDYGIGELRRDDIAHYSEMRAWAWDQQTNTRSSSTFVVPHRRDKAGGGTVLTDLRDVYENNANMGARRLREAIFSILPRWFTCDAEARCMATLEKGGGKPLAERVAAAITLFGERWGVTADQLATRLGRKSNQWTPIDLAQLTVLHQSLAQGTVELDDEFPAPRVTAAEITAAAGGNEAPKPRRGKPAEPTPDDDAADAQWRDEAQA